MIEVRSEVCIERQVYLLGVPFVQGCNDSLHHCYRRQRREEESPEERRWEFHCLEHGREDMSWAHHCCPDVGGVVPVSLPGDVLLKIYRDSPVVQLVPEGLIESNERGLGCTIIG
jgi:hypothetical protein